MKKIMLIAVSLLTMFLSCKKENEITSSQSVVTLNSNKGAKISTSGTQTIYEVDPVIIGNFKHFCQKDAGPATTTYPNGTGNLTPTQAGNACGATSYMMSAYCIAKYINSATSYTCSGSKLASIVSITGAPTGISNLKSYADKYDNSFIVSGNSYTTVRLTSNQFIKDALAANKFVIVGVNSYVYDYNTVNNSNLYGTTNNPDLNAAGNIVTGSNRNYITDNDESSGTVGGHVIILIRLITNADGTGVVEYIDPLAQTKQASNRRYVSFTRLLNAMAMNGSNTQYDAISIGQK